MLMEEMDWEAINREEMEKASCEDASSWNEFD